MTSPTPNAAARTDVEIPWTCPFCSLLCDGFTLAHSGTLELLGSDCPKAKDALAAHSAGATSATPMIDGRSASLDEALATAASMLAGASLPLFGGLATDVAGMRALYALASTHGAILDHVLGDTIMNSLRSLQDRGVFYTTLAEVRTRADLILCIGTTPGKGYPEFFRRITPSESRKRDIVFLGTGVDPSATESLDVAVEAVPLDGDLFLSLALLNALCTNHRLTRPAPAAIAGLASRLQRSRYAVIVWEPGTCGSQGALIGEAIHRLVGTLNAETRAASLALGGSQGAYTANQVVTWMSGLPLRTGLFRDRLRHEPTQFAAGRLLGERTVDLLLWVSSFDPASKPPSTDIPTIVIGHPDIANARPPGAAPRVFIPVSTPGIGSAGHLFRLDGGVVVPLVQVRDDGLPTVAAVARALVRPEGR